MSSRAQNAVYRYRLPSISGRTHVLSTGNNSRTRDIARTSGGTVWVATDYEDAPLRRFSSSGEMTGFVDGSLVGSARGVAMDPDGSVWVSDISEGVILKLDVSE